MKVQTMKTLSLNAKLASRSLSIALSVLGLLGVAFSLSAAAQTVNVQLNGAQEVPAVMTTATGSGVIVVGADKSVSGSVTVSGLEPTMAHLTCLHRLTAA